MKQTNSNYQNQTFFTFISATWKAFALLFLGFIITLTVTIYTRGEVEIRKNNEFSLVCNVLKTEINARLHAHAQLLRSGSSFFMASDSVTRNEWKSFIEKSKLKNDLPGIQGVGYTCIIPKNLLQRHIQNMRNQGFPDYTIKPEGERDSYTSIIYLEPFNGRNLRAFGFDMLTEPVRRKAMEHARDNDIATLSGKVQLVQETYSDVQAGTLMYVPVYRNGKPTHSLAERRAAILGWVYSPYWMNDLMHGILGPWDAPDNNRIHLKVYDTDSVSTNSLLFDSQRADSLILDTRNSATLILPVEFNGTKWTLSFSQPQAHLAYFEGEVLLVFLGGIVISLLLFGLALSLILTKTRAARMAVQLTSELKQSEIKFKTVADYTHDWEYWIGADNRLIYMSPSCERISGYKPEEFFDQPLLLKKIVHPEDSVLFDHHLLNVHDREQIHEHASIIFRILKKDGSIVYIEHLCSPVYDENGIFTGRRVSDRDITQARQAESIVIQTRRNYETFFNTIDEFLFVLDQQGNIIYTNSTVINRLGYTLDELKGQSVFMVHPPDRRDEAGHIVGLMLQGAAEFCPVPLCTKTGLLIPVETRVTAGLWDGSPVIFGVTKDVSQIQLSQEKFSKMFNLNPSAAGLSDLLTGKYIEVNEAFYDLLGFNASEVIGNTASGLGILTDEARTKLFREVDIFGNIRNLEADLRAKNGDIKHVLLSAENIYIQEKKYRYTVVYDITSRTKTEKEKEELLDRLQKIASRVPGMVYQYKLRPDGSSCFPYASEGINSIYRVRPEEVREDAAKVLASLHPDDYAGVVDSIQASARDMEPWRHEYRVKFGDGAVRWLSGSAMPQTQEDGSILWHGFIADVTERKQADELLRWNQSLLQLMSNSSPLGFLVVDNRTDAILYFNKRFCQIWGIGHLAERMSRGEMKNNDIIPDCLPVLADIPAFAESCKPLQDEANRLVLEDEIAFTESRTIRRYSTQIRGENDEYFGRFYIFEDITKRKQVEADLKTASTRLLLAARAGGVGVWDYDLVNNVLFWDDQMFALYGITKNEFSGAYEAWLAGVHPDYKAQGDAEIQMAINGEKEFDSEFKVLWPDGSIHDIRALAVVQHDNSGNPLRMIGTNWDITQQKKTETEIKLQNMELQRLNAEKDKFFSIIAHDLRSPFNGFLGYTQLLSEGVENFTTAKIQSFAANMRVSALNLFGLLENLLEWSLMQRGLITFNPIELYLLPVVENCIDMLRDTALTKRIEVTCFISPDLTAFASNDMLQSVIRNLLSNAIKFTPLGGTITVLATCVNDNMVELAIQDTGIGMDEEIIGNLFKLGVSTSRRGTEGEASTGLGLYLCKDFVEKQGGKLWAETCIGLGSTFRFTIPVKSEK
jgi:PAS domain S-box-containing protein